MKDSIISVLVGLFAAMFLNSKFEIVKIYLIKHGDNIERTNNIYYIYLALTTIVFTAIAYFLIWIFKLIINKKSDSNL